MKEKNWLQNFNYRVAQLFKRKDTSFPIENDYLYQKTMQRFGEWDLNILRDKSTVLNEIANDGRDIQRIGMMDGQRGQNPITMKRIVHHVAELWQSYIEPRFKEQLAIAESIRVVFQRNLNYLEERKKTLVDFQKVLNADHHVHSKNYNLILGIGYIVISYYLICADYPLSKKVVLEGFQITQELEMESLALGIVLITVYFKVFYDEYIGNTIPKSLLKNRVGFMFGKSVEDDSTDSKEHRMAVRLRGMKLGVKLVILTLLVLTLWSLGNFRASYLSISPETNGTFAKLMTEENTSNLFILLSIVFPVIGGICASLGINSLQNVFDRWILLLKLWFLQLRIQRKEKHMHTQNGLIQSLNENLEWVRKDGDFINETADYFFAFYMHGFEAGNHQKLSGDMYHIAEEMRLQSTKLQSTKMFYNAVTEHTSDKNSALQFFNDL